MPPGSFWHEYYIYVFLNLSNNYLLSPHFSYGKKILGDDYEDFLETHSKLSYQHRENIAKVESTSRSERYVTCSEKRYNFMCIRLLLELHYAMSV